MKGKGHLSHIHLLQEEDLTFILMTEKVKKFLTVHIMNILSERSSKFMQEEVWIALLEVTPCPKCELLDEGTGAFVNALVLAKNILEYQLKIEQALNELYLVLVGIEDIELLSERSTKFLIDEKILQLAKDVQTTNSVRFSTSQIYESE
jgi:hypothetical protein